MVQALTKLLTCAEFIFQYGNNPRYELADGEVIDMERTGLQKSSVVNWQANWLGNS